MLQRILATCVLVYALLVQCLMLDATNKTDGFLVWTRRKPQRYWVVSRGFATRSGPKRRGFMLQIASNTALCLCAAVAFAADAGAVELNRASVAELDGLRGIGPALSRRILEAREQAPFQDWNDFFLRVSGVGPRSAARLSQEGLTVNGQPFDATQGRPARAPKPAADGAAR